MSIADQLQKLKNSTVNVFEVDIKNKKSLIYEDSSSIGRIEAFQKCKKGFIKLCKLDDRFKKFENLYNEKSIDLVPQLLKEEEYNQITKSIRRFLYMLTPYIDIDFALIALEWMIFKYEAHIHLPEDLLITCLPFHNNEIFIKIIRLFNLKKKKDNPFSWLKHISLEGKPISSLELSGICIKHPDVLEMICSWPLKVIEDSENNAKELCHLIITQGTHILGKVKLFTKEKQEKYLGPFVRLIYDAVDSTNENFNAVGILLLLIFSESIFLDKNFLSQVIKKILKNSTVNLYVRMKSIIDICDFQQYKLKPKQEKLFNKNLENLNEDEKNILDEYINKKLVKEIIEDMKDTQMIEKSEVNINLCAEKKIKEVIKVESIDWNISNIEESLIELLIKNILNWEGQSLNNLSAIFKMGRKILKLLKSKPKELKIEYKPNGLISNLCLALMNPDIKIKKLAVRLINKFADQWPNHTKFGKILSQVCISDNNSVMYGEISKIILHELNTLSQLTTSVTASATSLKLLNHKNICDVPDKMVNIWDLLLNKLSQTDIVNNDNGCLYRDAVKTCLIQIRESFSELSVKCQQEMLDSIVSNLNRSENDLSCCTEYLSLLPLSLENVQYLLKDNDENSNNSSKRKSIKKFNTESSLTGLFISEFMQKKIKVVLSAFCAKTSISVEDQVGLINPIVTFLMKIVSNLSREKLIKTSETDSELSSESNTVDLVKNIMVAMSTILSGIIESPTPINLDRVSNKVRLEVFSKCLYLFQCPLLNEINISVIQKIIKLGLDEFNLIYFISWVGNYLVPRDDQNSLRIVNHVIKETLPLCIKQKKENSLDKVQIIVKFVKECVNLPKHRALLFFESVVQSLSEENQLEFSALWIQLIFMVSDNGSSSPNQNESILIPLLMKFSVDEQLFTWTKIISFLSGIIQDTSRKRKLVLNEFTSSPINKKRKGENCDYSTKFPVSCFDVEDQYFASVKENLLNLNKKMDPTHILQKMIKYCNVHLQENSSNLIIVSSNIIKDFIGGVFKCIKRISHSSVDAVKRNEFCQSLLRVTELVGSSLNKNVYLSMLVDMMTKDTEEAVRSKCIELMAKKFSSMTASKVNIIHDNQIVEIARFVFPAASEIVMSQVDSIDWNFSLVCISNMVALGLSNDDQSKKICEKVFKHLLNADFHKLVPDKIVIINWFFKHYIIADHYEDLVSVFNCCLVIIEKAIKKTEFRNGEVESSLSLMHAIICRIDSHTIGWDRFCVLLERIFEFVSIDCKMRKLTKESCDYQKQIRVKLSKTGETKSLIDACCYFMDKGIEEKNLIIISGSISLFGCHLIHLNKINSKYRPNEESGNLWDFIHKSMSLNEIFDDGYQEVLEISKNALVQLCKLFDFDEEILKKMFSWTQKSELTPSTYLQKYWVLFQFISALVNKSSPNNKEKVIEFINGSQCISDASGLLKHLSVEISGKTTERKRRKIQSQFMCPFTTETLTKEYPKKCAELLKSLCNGVTALLRAENKMGMNLSISDDTINLISNACQNMVTIDNYLDKDEYRSVAEKHLIPLIIQLASNSYNDQALLTPLTMALCKHYSELSSNVILAVLKTFVELKACLGDLFESCIKDNVVSFLEDCKLHDNPDIVNLANEI